MRDFLKRLKPIVHLTQDKTEPGGKTMSLCGITNREPEGEALVAARWYCARCVRIALRKMGADVR